MTDFDLTTLRLLVGVVEERGIARAARKNNITAAAVSKRISELELRIGVRLIERHARDIRPTPAGAMLIQTATKVLRDIDAIRGALSEFVEGIRGEVRIFSGTSGIVGPTSEKLHKFAIEYPGIVLKLCERHTDQVVRAVQEGTADIGIFSPQVETKGLDLYPYQEIRLVVVCSRKHELAKHKSIWFSEALEHEFIGMMTESALGMLLASAVKQNHLAINSRFEVAGHETVRSLVRANIGIGILPEMSARPYADALNIHCIRLRDSWSQYHLQMCTRPHAGLSLPVRKVLDYLLGHAG